jgi:glycosyltransferase involved in cell wall biosynthesis
MPLVDNEWVKGKCSFKMLQYMSAGVPVVVSPFGMNSDVLSQGKIGFGPISGYEWYQALELMIKDTELNNLYGMQARALAEDKYSLERVVEKWISVFNKWL